MSQWYYARNRQQNGPVSFEQLKELAQNDGLSPADMVWNPPMPDWIPASSVQGLFSSSSNPYATPATTFTGGTVALETSGESLAEIEPGSDPIQPTACISRGFDLTKRNFAAILLASLLFFGISWALGFVLGLLQTGGSYAAQGVFSQNATTIADPKPTPLSITLYIGIQLISNVVSIFLTMGFTRIGLDFVSGKTISVGQLFSQGDKLLRGIGASILYGLAVFVGLILLIVPGIYIALRYSCFLTAIVDRNLGIMDSFRYSAKLTENNKLNLLVLGFLGFLIMLLGLLACCIGIIFTYPVAWLAWIVAYRWMQYGRNVVVDHPGTHQPLLKQ